MPKMHSKPWKDGVKTQIFRMMAALSLVLFSAVTAAGSTNPPLHKLHISFDVEAAVMHGTSVLEIPANSGAIYHTPGLAISGIWINDRAVDLNDQSQPYFADPDHELTIAPSPLPTMVKVVYTLTLTNRNTPLSDLISGDGISLTGLWHPFLHQDQIFELTADIPLNFTAISEAEEIATTIESDHKTVSFSFNHPLSGINFIAAPFQVEKSSFGDDRELYTYFFAEDADLVAEYRQKALAYLARYEKLIGPFPYKRFSVVENRLPTGYAMPTFTVLGQSVVRLPFITDTSLGHETLHQWFGNSVRNDPAGGNWSEGLVTMLADALYQREQGNGREFRKNQMIRHHSYVHGDNSLALKDFIGVQSHLVSGQEASRAVGYTQAAMLFQMLENKIGEEKFIAGLRELYQRFKHQKAGWEGLITSFEQVSGLDLQDFFAQWLNRTDLPVINVVNLSVDETKGLSTLRFKLHQTNGGGPFNLSLPVTVVTDNARVNRVVEVTGNDIEVEIPLSSTPRELIIDEDYQVLRRLAPSELPPVWSRFAGAKEKLVVLDANQDHDLFRPLVNILAPLGARIVSSTEVTNNDIAGADTVFLGTTSPASRNLFARPDFPETGMSMEVRKNPLNPALTVALVSAANGEEVRAAAPKIRHYGKYSYLHFELGRIMAKDISKTPDGQLFFLDRPPGGIEIGANLSFDKIVAKLRDRQVVYIGESHTRYEDHLLQLRIIRAMYHQNPDLSIGMEMFARSAQEALDSYVLDHTIDEEEFLRQSRYMIKWGYDYRFYQPIINFARLNRIPVIGLNQDKDLVSKVFKDNGLEGLDQNELAAIPDDLDLSLPEYRQRLDSVFQMHNGQNNRPNQFNNFFQAQSVWDETMAESIAEYLAKNPRRRMAVVAGVGHVDKKNAIPPRVARRMATEQAVVLNVAQYEVDGSTADYLFFSGPATLPPAAMIGVVLQDLAGEVVVDKISPHGMGGKAGIKSGDVILAIDGKNTPSVEELKIIMFFKKKGEKAVVKIRRARKIWRDRLLEIEVPL